MDVACGAYPADESDPPHSDCEMVKVDDKVGRQLAQALAVAKLSGRFEPQALVDMLFISGDHQAMQFAPHGFGIWEGLPQQHRLEPAIEVFPRAVPLWSRFRNEDGLHA